MRRLSWIVPVGLLIALTVAITSEVVKAQIIFPDQTVQDTAFTGGRAVPTGANFVRTRTITQSSPMLAITLDTIPVDQELVVLKLVGWSIPLCTLESRLPSPNQNTGPITLAVLYRELATDNGQFVMDFPDGAVIVDEGRQPWLNFRSTTDFSSINSPGGSVSALTLIGYLRNKP